MDLNNLPVIDWELGVKLAGNNRNLAEEMVSMLTQSLSKEYATIEKLYREEDYPQLLQRVHRLHGALCYCGLPRLKKVISTLEIDLKNKILVNIPFLMDQLGDEINLLLKAHPLSEVKCAGDNQS